MNLNEISYVFSMDFLLRIFISILVFLKKYLREKEGGIHDGYESMQMLKLPFFDMEETKEYILWRTVLLHIGQRRQGRMR